MSETTTCPVCRTAVSMNADGTMRRHKRDGEPCPAAEAIQHVALPWAKVLTQNQVRRMHPLVEAREKRRMLDEARWVIRAAKLKRYSPDTQVIFTLHYRPGTRRACDADGLAPTVKVTLDALVHEGILADDQYLYVPEVRTRIHPPQAGMPVGVWASLQEEP